MIFDWYQAAVEHHPDTVLGVLNNHFSGSSVEQERAANGYEYACKIVRGETVLARAQWGGNTGGRVQVKSTGIDAPDMAELCRSTWAQDHLVQRCDVAIDYDDEQAFEILRGAAVSIADKHSLNLGNKGDWERGKGRTLYIGSRQSPVMARIYEKGWELRQKGISPNASLDLARIEYEFKPKKERARRLFAFLTPEEMLGGSRWSRELADVVHGLTLVPITGLGTVKRCSDRDRAINFAAKQYGAHFESLADELGSAAALGEHLIALVQSLKRSRDGLEAVERDGCAAPSRTGESRPIH